MSALRFNRECFLIPKPVMPVVYSTRVPSAALKFFVRIMMRSMKDQIMEMRAPIRVIVRMSIRMPVPTFPT